MAGESVFATLCDGSGGRGGIRTPGTFDRSFDFESSALNRTQPPFRFTGAEK